MDYFQLRKNTREVIRISRGPFEGHDITKLHVWYRDKASSNYLPGRAVVAFNSLIIPGAIEGLLMSANQEPKVTVPPSFDDVDLTRIIRAILVAHRQPLHWEVLVKMIEKEHPQRRTSKWMIYNTLLWSSHLFDQVEEDVFVIKA